jgi:hypothetical protein
MTADQYRQAIFDLLRKTPAPTKIDTVQKVRRLKAVHEAAKKAAVSSKASLERLQSTHNELSLFLN